MSSGYTLNRFSGFTFERPSLDQFVVLSLMLHVLLIVLFGDTTGGGARRGEKLWGALTVTVQGFLPDSGIGLKLDRGATLLKTPVSELRPAPVSPGAVSRNRDVDAPAPVEKSAPVEEATPPAQAPTFEMPPVISKDVEKAVTEFVIPKPSVDRAYVPPVTTQPNEQAPREAVVTPPPMPTSVIVAPIPPALAPPSVERALVVPVPIVTSPEPKPREEAVALPAPAPKPEPTPPKLVPEVVKPVAPAPQPKPREITPPVVPTPAPAPTIPTAPIVPAPLKPESVQPVATPVETKPREVPVAPPAVTPAPSEPLPRAEAPKPPKIERDIATPALPAASVTTPAPAPSRTTAVPSGSPGADRDALTPRSVPVAPPADGLAPDKSKGIDLDAVRRRAREISSGGTGPRTVFPFPVAPQQKPKSKEQQAFDKALKKNDCRDAYADMGLAAVVPLVLDAVREGGCKW